MRISSAGVISCPHCGQVVESDAITFCRLIFPRAGMGVILPSFPYSKSSSSVPATKGNAIVSACFSRALGAFL
jgi:hypothetical protein